MNAISERRSAPHTLAESYLALFAGVIQTGHSLVVMEMAEASSGDGRSGGGRGKGTNMLNTDQLLTKALPERRRQSTEPLVPRTATRLFKLLSSISAEEQVREGGPWGGGEDFQLPRIILRQKRQGWLRLLRKQKTGSQVLVTGRSGTGIMEDRRSSLGTPQGGKAFG